MEKFNDIIKDVNKTYEKIKDVDKKQKNCIFYITTRYSSQEYHIIPLESGGNNYNIECGTKYIDGKQKKLLDENKIQVLEFNDLELYYTSKEYIDNISKRIKELKRLYMLAVENIKHIYSDKHIYENIDM